MNFHKFLLKFFLIFFIFFKINILIFQIIKNNQEELSYFVEHIFSYQNREINI
jgi:preprotein translocase subunit SecG